MKQYLFFLIIILGFIPISENRATSVHSEQTPNTEYQFTKVIDDKILELKVGTMSMEPTFHGKIITPKITGLAPGIHAMAIANDTNCLSAVENYRYDLPKTLSDPTVGQQRVLPPLYVNKQGITPDPIFISDTVANNMSGKAILIFTVSGDDKDQPLLLRKSHIDACGEIKNTRN